jgi:hypothetical protein
MPVGRTGWGHTFIGNRSHAGNDDRALYPKSLTSETPLIALDNGEDKKSTAHATSSGVLTGNGTPSKDSTPIPRCAIGVSTMDGHTLFARILKSSYNWNDNARVSCTMAPFDAL